MNPWSKGNHYLGIDEFIEELVQAIKDQYNLGNSDSLDNYIRYTISHCLIYFMAIKNDMRNTLGLQQ